MTPIELDSHPFIVRIWREKHASTDKPQAWRGMIEYIPTNQRYYFRSFEAMISFLRQCADLPEEPSSQ